jgi:hypothetical protein
MTAPPMRGTVSPDAAHRRSNRRRQMAIGVQIDFDGATLDQYDEVVAKMGFEPGGRGEPGGLFHWVTKTDTGIRVTDVWESQEIFERFAREKIGPLTAAVGLMTEPRISFYDVHNYLTAG